MNSEAIYIVGPLTGLDADAMYARFHGRAGRLRDMGYTVYNPMGGKDHLKGTGEIKASGYVSPLSMDHAVYQRDQWMCHRADVIYADFTSAARVSIGSCFELAWASRAGKMVILVMDTDQDGGHPMDHLFIHKAATLVFKTTLEAENYLRGHAEELGMLTLCDA